MNSFSDSDYRYRVILRVGKRRKKIEISENLLNKEEMDDVVIVKAFRGIFF